MINVVGMGKFSKVSGRTKSCRPNTKWFKPDVLAQAKSPCCWMTPKTRSEIFFKAAAAVWYVSADVGLVSRIRSTWNFFQIGLLRILSFTNPDVTVACCVCTVIFFE